MSFPASLTSLFENKAPYEAFEKLFKQSPDIIYSQDIYGRTPLYMASIHNRLDVLLFLLGQNANINEATNTGVTPLIIAALNGHVDVVKALIEAGADIDKATDSGATPLYIAIEEGRFDVVKALIQAGADVDKPINDGTTPLFTAAEIGYVKTVKALIEAGAYINKALNDGTTALYIATAEAHFDVVKTLIGAGANIDKAVDIGATPLYVAAQNGHVELARALIESGADVDKATDIGATPLFIAAQSGHVDVVKALLEAGANIHLRWKTKNCTPLHIAALADREECFQLLLTHPKVTTRMLADIILDANVSERYQTAVTAEFEKRLKLASQETLRAWPTCPITNTVILDPVIGSDGQCYEKSQITRWLEENQTSPTNRQAMTIDSLIKPLYLANWIEHSLKQLDEAFLSANPVPMDISPDNPMDRETLANHRATFFDRKRKREELDSGQEEGLSQNKQIRIE